MRLLRDFKAARLRRDAMLFGSPEWNAADDEIQRLQHDIFDLSFDDPTWNRHPGRADDVARSLFAPDDELGQPEDPSAL
jgi:hypothetical protein